MKHVAIILTLVASPSQAIELPAPITPDDFIDVDPQLAKIGQLLFYDKILSGNRNIACATCHHHNHASADGLSLGIGEGGVGIGPERHAGTGDSRIRKRIPRNSPALWNLGHRSIDVLFHDGRLESSDLYGNGFSSPAEEWLPEGLDNILAAQALFPLVARFEMAGDPRENEVAGAVFDRIDAAWPIIADRIRHIPAYAEMFAAAESHIKAPLDITIVDIGNALGAFMTMEWQSYDSPFDDFLNGKADLPLSAKRGMDLFYGDAGCADCHSGPLLTDQQFHALALPPFGPGRTRPFDPYARDRGRIAKSNRLEDAYRFRTPSLRNAALTAPYGHNGAYPTLEGIIRHHADPLGSLETWQPETANLPAADWLSQTDFVVWDDRREMGRFIRAVDIGHLQLDDRELADLVAFIEALTGSSVGKRPFGRPESVPSGIAVD